MTLDDNSSVYVGGLPYDITEDGLRRVFYKFGAIIAVKIINDRTIGGKCYGFVTFASPRSASEAIAEMDGKTIHGRVIKVNDVRTRGGKPHFNRDPRQEPDRSMGGDRGRDRGRDDSHDRHRHQEGHRDRSQDHEENRERGQDRIRGHDRMRDRYEDEERLRDYMRHADEVEQHHGRKREHEWERDDEKNIEQQRNTIHRRSRDKEQQLHNQKSFGRAVVYYSMIMRSIILVETRSCKWQCRQMTSFSIVCGSSRSRFDDHGSREFSLDSYSDDLDQGENQLAASNLKLDELRKERSQMEELIAEKDETVSQLQEKYQKLKDSLIATQKLTSRRHIQLTKLHKCYLQMRDYDERFKQSQQELQWLVDSTSTELENDGGGDGDGIVTNGRA